MGLLVVGQSTCAPSPSTSRKKNFRVATPPSKLLTDNRTTKEEEERYRAPLSEVRASVLATLDKVKRQMMLLCSIFCGCFSTVSWDFRLQVALMWGGKTFATRFFTLDGHEEMEEDSSSGKKKKIRCIMGPKSSFPLSRLRIKTQFPFRLYITAFSLNDILLGAEYQSKVHYYYKLRRLRPEAVMILRGTLILTGHLMHATR